MKSMTNKKSVQRQSAQKFWDWITDEDGGRVLRLEGPIDSESLWGNEITPKAFRDELNSEEGDVTVWLNSPGGNVFAASEIYTMLRDYTGNVTVKIDAIAASAASVVAMAGNHVAMSPTSMLMIHDPSTIAYGNTKDMEKAITVLNEVKESILNAYCEKSGLSRAKVAKLMSNETWMNAKKAYELGFADEVLFSDKRPTKDKPDDDKPDEDGDEDEPDEDEDEDEDDDKKEKKPFKLSSELELPELAACMYSSRQMDLRILNSLGVDTDKPRDTDKLPEPPKEPPKATEPVDTEPVDTEPAKTENRIPIIGMDGKTEDGAMPYTILMNQLECMR